MLKCVAANDAKYSSTVFIVWWVFCCIVLAVSSFTLQRVKRQHEQRMLQRYDRLSRIELTTVMNDADSRSPRSYDPSDKVISV